MKKAYIFVVGLLFLVGSSLFADDIFDDVDIVSVNTSSTTGAVTPGYYLTDSDLSSDWAIAEEYDTGWAVLNLSGKTYIHGMRLYGDLGADSRLIVEYRYDNSWIGFTGGHFSENELYGNEFIEDLSYDRVVTDSIRLRLENASDSYIGDVEITGADADTILYKITPEISEETDNSYVYYPVTNMTDGNTYTSWKAINSHFGGNIFNELETLSDNNHGSRCGNGGDRGHDNHNDDDTKIEFKLKDDFSPEEIRIYFSEHSKGDVIIELERNGEWEFSEEISGYQREPGWHSIDLSYLNGETIGKIRMLLRDGHFHGRGFERDWYLGGISEFEIWGYGSYPGDGHQSLLIKSPEELIEPFNTIFYLDEDTLPDNLRLDVLIEGEITENLFAELNISELEINNFKHINGNTLYSVNIEKDMLWDLENFVRILPFENGESGVILDTVLTEVNSLGRQPLYKNMGEELFLPDSYVTDNSTVEISLGYNILLKDLKLLHDNYSYRRVYAYVNEEWQELYLEDENDYYTQYSIEDIYGDVITTDRIRIEKVSGDEIKDIMLLGSPVTDRAPLVEILYPENESFINVFNLFKFLIGKVDNPDTVIKVNGYDVQREGNYFWINLGRLGIFSSVESVITAEAVDTSGRTGTDEVHIYTGREHRFSLDQPDKIYYTSEDTFLISGRAGSGRDKVTINDEEVNINGKRFSKNVELVEGLNIIRVKCFGSHGRLKGILIRKVYKYTGDIILKIDSPPSEYYTQSSDVYISGTVQGVGEITVRINGNETALTGNRFNSLQGNLSEGENKFVIEAVDEDGNSVIKDVTVIRDTTAPVISDVNPVPGTIINTSVFTVTLNADELNPVWVYVNGKVCTKTGELSDTLSSYTVNISHIDSKACEVFVRAVDIAGNESVYTYNVIVDTTPPLAFDAVADPSGWTNNVQPVISFETTDETSGINHYELKVDEGDYAVAASPYTLSPQINGIHTVTVKAVDNAGWETYSSVDIYIDTIPPETPEGFNLIPGNAKIIVEWEASDEDTILYRIERTPEWDDKDYEEVTDLAFTDTEVNNGDVYQYNVRAVDRAYNESDNTEALDVMSGLEQEPYIPGEEAVAEYDGVSLYIQKDGLSEDVSTIQITEITSDDMEEESVYSILGPMYEFSLLDENGENIEKNDGVIQKDYVGVLRYDESLIPEGFPEDGLGVYYYDNLWNRWFLVDSTGIDKENNLIYFSCNHFSIYSIQPTEVTDLGPDEYKDAGYSPFKTYSQHGSLMVSPQGGSVSTNVTELVLPGPNGFDLTISRRYDSATANSDAAFTVDEYSKLIPYMMNQGDFAYSMGKGWRLDLPYIKNANKNQIVVLPGGSMYSFWGMNLNSSDHSGDKGYLNLEQHDGADFTLYVSQERETVSYSYLPGLRGAYVISAKRWVSKSYLLRMNDGTEYAMDEYGRCVRITDPTGQNSIFIIYQEDSNQINFIQDAIGRRVYFTYKQGEPLPYIKHFEVRNWGMEDSDPYGREVTYTIDDNGILTDSNDAGGRKWHYDYASYEKSGPLYPIPYNLLDALNNYGVKDFNEIMEQFNEPEEYFHDVNLLDELRGPGKGIIKVDYVSDGIADINRLNAYQVAVYDSEENYNNNSPVRLTTYDYNFEVYEYELEVIKKDVGDPGDVHIVEYTDIIDVNDNDDDPETKTLRRGYVESTREIDGIRENVYTYQPFEKISARWVETDEISEDEEDVRAELGDDYIIVSTRQMKIEKKDSSAGNTLQTIDIEYEDDSTDIRPWKKIIKNAEYSDNYKRELTYQYDGWGNILNIDDYTVSGGRVNHINTERIYQGSFAVAVVAKAISIPGIFFPPAVSNDAAYVKISSFRHNLLASETITNFTPLNNNNDPINSEGQPSSQMKRYEYNGRGQVKNIQRWDSSKNEWLVASYIYDYELGQGEFGNVVQKTDPEGNITDYQYDVTSGYLTRKINRNVTDANGYTEDIISDYNYERISGWLLSETNPRGLTTYYTYDALGRVKTITQPKDDDEPYNPVTNINYYDGSVQPADPDILYAEVTDPVGRRTRYEFNCFGQLVRIIKYSSSGAEESVTGLTYNRWGDISSITDPNENITSYSYDAMGRRNQIWFPDNTTQTMNYNYITNILTVLNARGDKTETVYDMSGNVIEETLFNDSEEINTIHYYDGVGNEVLTIGPRPGFKVVKKYNSLNQLVEVIMPYEEFLEPNGLGGFTEVEISPVQYFSYDRLGNKIKDIVTGPNNEMRISEYTLDEIGRTIVITQKYRDNQNIEHILNSSELFYDENGNTVKVIDANNVNLPSEQQNTVEYTYSSRNKVLSETDMAGNITTYTYYPDDNIRTITEPRGNCGKYPEEDFSVYYFYDDLNRLFLARLPSKTDESGPAEIQFEYDDRGNLIKQINPDLSEVDYTYNSRNWVRTEEISGDGESYLTIYYYDEIGNVIQVVDNRGEITRNKYDDLSRLIEVTYPEGNKEQFEYDEAGNQIAYTDGNNNRTEFEYDLFNRLKIITSPSGNTSYNDYDRLGNLTRNINPLGQEQTYLYDRLNRLTKDTDSIGNTYTFEYDYVGNILTSTDPNGTTGTYQYTDNYQLELLTLTNGNETKVIEYRYDEAGVLLYANDDGVETSYNGYDINNPDSYEPDAYSRIFTENTSLDGKDYIINYSYDLGDRVNNVMYPNGNDVEYEYNKLGELLDVPGYLNGTPQYEDGLLISLVSANNIISSFDYDDNGRLINLSYETMSLEIKNYDYVYDNANNIIQKNNNFYYYDNENRLERAELNGTFAVNTEDEQQAIGVTREDLFGFNELDFNSEELVEDIIVLDYAAGSIGVDLGDVYEVTRILLTPDNTENRVNPEKIRVFTAASNIYNGYTEVEEFAAQYVEINFKTHLEIILPEGTIAKFIKVKTDYNERNADNEPVDFGEFKGNPDGIIKVFFNVDTRIEHYTYDALGNRQSVSIETGPVTKEAGYFYYPDSNRLITNGKWAYTYDANGNILEKGDTVLIEGVSTKVCDVSTDYWDSLTSSISGNAGSLTFDIEEGSTYWKYTFDLMNRLVSVEKNSELTAEYTYNYLGLRVKKERPNASDDGEVTATYFMFSLGGRVLYEEDEVQGQVEEDFRQYVYVLGKHFAREDGQLDEGGVIIDESVVRYYMHTDHLGSVVVVTNEAGEVVWDNEYTPFGDPAEPYKEGEDGYDARFNFTGKDLDEDTGLYYFNARWYDPDTGRFISLDPIRDGMNYYIYCANNPLKYIDPLGLRGEETDEGTGTGNGHGNGFGGGGGQTGNNTGTGAGTGGGGNSSGGGDSNKEEELQMLKNMQRILWWSEHGTISYGERRYLGEHYDEYMFRQQYGFSMESLAGNLQDLARLAIEDPETFADYYLDETLMILVEGSQDDIFSLENISFRELMDEYNSRHFAVQKVVASLVLGYIEETIAGGSAKGNYGRLDIRSPIFGNRVWEVKPDKPRYATGAGRDQLRRYLEASLLPQNQEKFDGSLQAGFPLPNFSIPWGDYLVLNVRSGDPTIDPLEGGMLYYSLGLRPDVPMAENSMGILLGAAEIIAAIAAAAANAIVCY